MIQQRGNRPPSGSVIVAGILIVILAVVTVVSFFTVFQFEDAVTEQARRTDALYQWTLAVCLIVFFLVTAAIIWAVFRYQRRSPDEMPEQVHGSSVLEVTWTIIPIVILVGLFIPSLILLLDLKTPPSEAEADVVVEVVGHQWWWEFIYPDEGIRVQATPPNYDDLTPPRLVVPVDKTVLIRLRSTDVIHSFSVPHTLYKIQAIPGNVNEMHFKVEKAKEYRGQCFQFCGLRHSDMRFILDARSEADYERWLTETKRAQGVLVGEDAVSSGSVSDGSRSE